MKRLYSFKWQLDEGPIEGLFIADEYLVEASIGRHMSFGKFFKPYRETEIFGTLHRDDLEVKETSQEIIEELERIFGSSISGYNPLNFIEYYCDECGCEIKDADESNTVMIISGERVILCEKCAKEFRVYKDKVKKVLEELKCKNH